MAAVTYVSAFVQYLTPEQMERLDAIVKAADNSRVAYCRDAIMAAVERDEVKAKRQQRRKAQSADVQP